MGAATGSRYCRWNHEKEQGRAEADKFSVMCMGSSVIESVLRLCFGTGLPKTKSRSFFVTTPKLTKTFGAPFAL